MFFSHVLCLFAVRIIFLVYFFFWLPTRKRAHPFYLLMFFETTNIEWLCLRHSSSSRHAWNRPSFSFSISSCWLKTIELMRLSVGCGLCVPSFSRIIYGFDSLGIFPTKSRSRNDDEIDWLNDKWRSPCHPDEIWRQR